MSSLKEIPFRLELFHKNFLRIRSVPQDHGRYYSGFKELYKMEWQWRLVAGRPERLSFTSTVVSILNRQNLGVAITHRTWNNESWGSFHCGMG